MLFVKPIWHILTGGGHSQHEDKQAEAAAITDDRFSVVDASKDKSVIVASNTADKFNIRSNIVASSGD